MCHNVSGKEAIIKANSIHNSYARAVTVHGTWGNSEEDPGVEVKKFRTRLFKTNDVVS